MNLLDPGIFFFYRAYFIYGLFGNVCRNVGLPPLNVLFDGTQPYQLQGFFHCFPLPYSAPIILRFISCNLSHYKMMKNPLEPSTFLPLPTRSHSHTATPYYSPTCIALPMPTPPLVPFSVPFPPFPTAIGPS